MSGKEKISSWMAKPRHREEVVASERGWIVKRTGELLVSVPNMAKKLEEYFGTTMVLDGTDVPSTVQTSKATTPTQDETAEVLNFVDLLDTALGSPQVDDADAELDAIIKKAESEPTPKKRGRGRPKGSKNKPKPKPDEKKKVSK